MCVSLTQTQRGISFAKDEYVENLLILTYSWSVYSIFMILQSSCYQQNLVNYNWLVAVSDHRFRGIFLALKYNIRYCTFLSQSGCKYFFVLEINIVYYL